MGTDINGVFGHQIMVSAKESLADCIRAGMEKISPTCWSDFWWAPDNSDSSRLIDVGYGDFPVKLGPRAAYIVSGYSWPGPMDSPDKRQSVVSAMRAVARYFRSPHLIFLPDDIEPWRNAGS